MGNEAPQSRATLQDWEAWLAPQVRVVELLGEIPISAEECQQLAKVIGLRLLGYRTGCVRALFCGA